MQSFVTVVTPASNYDLTDVAAVKSELGITDNSEDTKIQAWVSQASGEISSYCNRVFAKETVKETFRVLFVRGIQMQRLEQIVLARSPIASIASAIMDGDTVLTEDTDYEHDGDGHLYRLDTNGNAIRWCISRLVVTYDAGYDIPPAPIARACISLVKVLRGGATRDPLVKSENVPGVGQTDYWIGGIPGTIGNLSPDIQAMLDPYRNVTV